MNESDLIDAVNERAAIDAGFRNRLEHAVATRSSSLIQQLVNIVIRELMVRVGRWIVDKVVDWFKS